MKAYRNGAALPTLSLLGTLFLVAPIQAATARATTPSASVEDDEKPDKRPEVKDALDRLSDHAKARGDEDHDAIALIDGVLMKEFEQSGPKDRKSIVDGISKCLKEKRGESKEGIRDNKLYMACAVALGTMGPESSKPLQGWINHKQHRRDLVLQRQLILSLGKVKDEKSIKFLIDLMEHQAPEVQGAAAEALGNFEQQKSDMRKEIFEETLKILGGAKTNVDQDVNDTVARERYDIIEGPMITTLQLMSGHDLRDPAEWQHWWNKNKKRDWDEEEG